MKKYLFALLIILLLGLSSLAWGQGAVQVSAEKTSSAIIANGGAYFHGITVITDGTNAVTVDIYGNTAAAVPKMIPTWVVTSSSTDRAQTYSIYPPVRSDGGIYVGVSVAGGGTCKYMVYYQ